ncbi:MAG: hypothetical protein WA888_16010 [Burkholderiaceae bacterium]
MPIDTANSGDIVTIAYRASAKVFDIMENFNRLVTSAMAAMATTATTPATSKASPALLSKTGARVVFAALLLHTGFSHAVEVESRPSRVTTGHLASPVMLSQAGTMSARTPAGSRLADTPAGTRSSQSLPGGSSSGNNRTAVSAQRSVVRPNRIIVDCTQNDSDRTGSRYDRSRSRDRSRNHKGTGDGGNNSGDPCAQVMRSRNR